MTIFRSSILLCLLFIAFAQSNAFAQPNIAIPKFIEETTLSGLNHIYSGADDFIVGGGVTVFDCNADGLPEVFLAGGEANAALFLNKSSVASSLLFEIVNTFPSLDRVTGAYALDIDSDTHKDLVILRFGANIVLRGLGDCQFEEANSLWNIDGGNEWTTAFTATWLPEASLPILVFGNYIDRTADSSFGNCSPNVVVRPAPSSNKYEAAEALSPSYCPLSLLFSDWNRSGRPSLRFSNDRQYYLTNKKRGGAEQLWKVSESGEFEPYTVFDGWQKLQIFGMGIASADITGDGYLDYFLTNMADNKLRILEDTDTAKLKPKYTDNAYKRGANAHRPFTGDQSLPSTGWHAEFADVNNDSVQDLFIVKGNVSQMPDFALEDPNNLLLGLEDGNFQEVADKAGLLSFHKGRGGAVTDLNLDGLLDIIVANRNKPTQLWRNIDSGNSDHKWLMLDVQGSATNPDGVGGWLELTVGDNTITGHKTIIHELTVGGGHVSHDAAWIHFGLGEHELVDIKMIWSDGIENHWESVSANQMLIVTKSALVKFEY